MHILFRGFLLVVFSCLAPIAGAALAADFKIVDVPVWVQTVAPERDVPISEDKQSAGMSYLLLDRQVFVKGNDKQAYHHVALKVQNESGLERAAQISIEFDPSYHALQLHYVNIVRGEKVIPKLSSKAIQVLQREKSLEYQIYDGTKTANLVLEDVRVGDIVEYAYTRRGSNPVFGGKHYGQMDLQWGFPVQKVYARIVTEPGRNPAIRLVNSQQEATVRSVGSLQSYEWYLSNVEGRRSKDDIPGWYDPYASIQWSDFRTWQAVVQWAVPLYKIPSSLTKELQEEVDRIKVTSTSAGERAVEALRFVQKNVRYLGVEVGAGSHAPTPPDVVMARRFGDCKDKTLLTLTLFKALGIEARPALVNTKVRKGIREHLAMPGAFDHVIVRAKLDGRTYWLDPTRAAQMGTLETISQPDFAYALVLEPGESALTAMEPGAAALYTRRVISVLDVRGGWKAPIPFTVTTMLEGISAERLRASLAKEAREDYQKHLVNYFARYYPGIAVERPYEVADNKATNQITMTEYYLLTDFWKKEKGEQMEGYVASPDINDYLRAPQNTVRAEPLALYHPIDIRQTTLVQLPPSWKLKAGTSEIKDAVFSVESSASVKPGLLTLVDTYSSVSDAVEPQAMPTYLANAKKARNLLGYTLSRSASDPE